MPLSISAETERYRVVATALNLRAEPVSGVVVDTLKYGDEIEVDEIRDGWARTVWNGKEGWCSLRYLVNLDKDIYAISDYGIEMIKEFEGYFKYAYWDYSQWTIGYGTRCEEGEYPDGITEEQADALLRREVVKYEMEVVSFLGYYSIEVTQNQFDALVSLTFNIGGKWTNGSTIADLLKDGVTNHSEDEIKAAFGEYVHAGGEVVQGLVDRRTREAEHFLSDEHFHSFKPLSGREASCTESGEMNYRCYCGAVQTRVIPATGHLYSEYFVILEPTKETVGEKMARCLICSAESETVKIPRIMPDININSWYYEGARYCIIEGYITGNDKGLFVPGGTLTREQFVVMLARSSGADVSGCKGSSFNDVKAGQWYAPYIEWAARKGYVKGIGDGSSFGVGRNITRQELCVMLYRYAESASLKTSSDFDLKNYTDCDEIASWAEKEVSFAIGAALMSSISVNELVFSPKMSVTRAQAAKIFMSFDNYKY